eukprot:12928282-Prorocentrum_lima.AAC.1
MSSSTTHGVGQRRIMSKLQIRSGNRTHRIACTNNVVTSPSTVDAEGAIEARRRSSALKPCSKSGTRGPI